MHKDIEKLIEELGSTFNSSYGYDFLQTWDKSDEDIKATLITAKILRQMHKNGISAKAFDSGTAISIFKDQSTRTRYSFDSATNFIGLNPIELDLGKSQVAHGETTKETVNMVSFLTRTIGIRDDIYLGIGHKYISEVAKFVQQGFDEGVLHNRPAVVNLQSDRDHPTQSMADLAHLEDYFGGVENLRGKKIAMTWAYSPSYGKPLSVPQGIIGLMTRFGADVTLAHPKNFSLIPDVVETSKNNAEKSGGSFKITDSMEEAFKGADIVYPKSWASYNIMEKRAELLSGGDKNAYENLEKDALAENAQHKDWECTEKMMELTNNALYMHCLPADITGVSCKEGEVENSVFERYRKELYQEASYKPFIIAAMILLGQSKTPHQTFQKLLAQNTSLYL
ncbi:knotted carbamoyltransferase YgeW [Candidatus Uabimicrobium sp. HlEnr_7]|uniref:knotted carbamoyltransferase YgeW n=1 Tax=Candidatus Uabimicrobium helgolandensis TaxID=3095367 RepID=UPI0035569454